MFQSQPLQNYTEIFNQRGELYHRAMTSQPLARRAEFECIIELANLQSGHVIADIPAGGGYMRAFLPDGVRLVAVETASAFLQPNQNCEPQFSGDESEDAQLLCADLSRIPLESETFDRVLSMAAVHHIQDTASFYREVWRLLKPRGVFVMADVRENSPIAEYLNGWVHDHNSMGHAGVFLNDSTPQIIQDCGFAIDSAAPVAYQWEFSSELEMVHYCRCLFGLDLASDAQILDGLKTILGVESDGARRRMNWELLFIASHKID